MSEQYNLKYDNYSNHLGSVWRDLFMEKTNSDITLVCEGEGADQVQFKVHKFVLCSCSKLFKTLLDHHNPYDSDPMIYLSGVNPRVMESILQFMYLGEATTDKDKIKELLKVADDLEIKASGLVVKDDTSQSPNTIMDFVASTSNYENSKKSNGENVDIIIPTKGSPETQLIECKVEISEDYKEISEDFKPDISHDEAVFNELSSGSSFLEYLSRANFNVENRVAMVEDIVKKEKKPRKERTKKIKDGNEVVKVKKERKIKTSNGPGEMFLCDRCDFTSKRKDFLQAHIDHIHEGIRYYCDQCSQQFKAQKYLITHVKTIHEGIRFPCPHCSYQATQLCNLKVHIESVHEGIRYPCDFCSYKATQKRHLKSHWKKMHSSEKRERGSKS